MATVVQRRSRGQGLAMIWSGWMFLASVGTCLGASQPPLDWSLLASKDAYYPGEPVGLTLTVRNRNPQDVTIWSEDDLEASSLEIRNTAGDVLTKGITANNPAGGIRTPLLQVPAGKTSGRLIVLNRWCSTLLLPADTYAVVCRIKYRVGEVREIELRVNVRIVPMDLTKFRDVLEGLRKQAFPTMRMEKIPTAQEERAAKEMLVLTESTLAVPYQLEILSGHGLPTQNNRDAVDSLARSGTLEAAVGLMKLSERGHLDDVAWDLVRAVYRLRATGQPEIITATDEFIQKHRRPTLRWHQVERDPN